VLRINPPILLHDHSFFYWYGAIIILLEYQGSGLPAGPAGILGAAEGLSFLSIAVGLTVFFLQITNYGYIPNAVPMEGAMCS